MTDNFVTMFGQFTDGNQYYANGNYQFIAAGNLMESAAVGLVTPVVMGQLDSLGSFSKLGLTSPVSLLTAQGVVAPNTGIPLLASDNFGTTNGQYNLLWNVKIVVQGFQNIIAYNIPLLFSNGATQNLFTWLQAGGWVPSVSPTEYSP